MLSESDGNCYRERSPPRFGDANRGLPHEHWNRRRLHSVRIHRGDRLFVSFPEETVQIVVAGLDELTSRSKE